MNIKSLNPIISTPLLSSDRILVPSISKSPVMPIATLIPTKPLTKKNYSSSLSQATTSVMPISISFSKNTSNTTMAIPEDYSDQAAASILNESTIYSS